MKCLVVQSFVFLVILATLVDYSWGHGMMLNPPGRSSRWRFDSTAPINYNDNANYCGGFGVHYYTNGGKCGLCGDNYADPVPRDNELGGKYGGSGVIVKSFVDTYTAVIGFKITANHMGHITYHLCNLDEFGKESEECFAKYPLKFADGSDKFYIGQTLGDIETTVVLPPGLSCKHCVLRWTYTAGNNWGTCEDGTGAIGCGNQETFKSCADVSIVAAGAKEAIAEFDILYDVVPDV
ncbi:uncharacterized protein LOC133335447 [Musca vetustissima]|uniref:uncharacterized protein LOC133335447 n=1 Tax=Musca vetustissima TaxID=27455 RepID=UPI002AB6819E|nr:uncharacterized protein LOC133335447 [Musca vetustissima]